MEEERIQVPMSYSIRAKLLDELLDMVLLLSHHSDPNGMLNVLMRKAITNNIG